MPRFQNFFQGTSVFLLFCLFVVMIFPWDSWGPCFFCISNSFSYAPSSSALSLKESLRITTWYVVINTEQKHPEAASVYSLSTTWSVCFRAPSAATSAQELHGWVVAVVQQVPWQSLSPPELHLWCHTAYRPPAPWQGHRQWAQPKGQNDRKNPKEAELHHGLFATVKISWRGINSKENSSL